MSNNKIDSLTVGVGLDSSDFKRGQREIDAGLEQLENSADDAAHSVDNLGDKAGKTGKNLSDLGGKSSEASQDIHSLGQSASDTSNSIENLGGTAEDTVDDVENLGEAAEDAAGDIEELGSASLTAAEKIERLQEQIKELEEDAKGSSDKLADLQDKLDNLKKSGAKTGKSLGSNFDQMARSVRGLANEVMGLMALNKMAGGGYGNAAAQAIDNDTSINRQAESVGMSPSRLNAWGKATEIEGGTAEEGRNFIQRVNDAFVGHTIDARQIPELIRNKISSTNPDGTPKQLEEILKDVLDLLSKEPDERKRSLVIRDFFGGGAGLTRLAGMGREGVEASIAKAQHRANLDDQDFQNIDQFSRAIREARQNVEGFGNGLLSWTAKMFGPTLEQLNKDHPALVGAGGAAATAGIVAGGWWGVKKLTSDVVSKAVEQSLKSAGVEVAEGAAGASAAEATTLLSRLALAARAANIAGAVYYGMKPTQTVGPEVDTLSGAGLVEAAPERPRDRWDKLNHLQQGKIRERIEARDKGETPAEWKYSQKWREHDESIWEEHQKNLEEYRKQAAAYLGIPADTQVPRGRSRDRWDDLNSWQQDTIKERIKSRDSGKVPKPWQGNDEQRAYDEGLWEEHQKNLEEYRKQVAEFQAKMSALPSASGLPLANDAGKSRYSGKVPKALDEMQDYLRMLEDQNGLPKGLLTEIAMKESGGNPNAVSRRDGKIVARGMFQFTPGTAMQYNLANPHDPMESARAAAEFYGKLSKDFGGDVDKMMASYNSGPGKVQQISRNFGGRWRDWLGPEGQGYINYEQVPGANKLLQYAARHSKIRADRALAVFPINGDAQQDYSQMQVPQQLQEQVNPALSPAVQQATIRNDNRRVTNTVHIDNMPINAPGGTSTEIAHGMNSALQRHPLRIDGSDYA